MMLVNKDPNNMFAVRQLDRYMEGHNGFVCGGCFKNIFNREKIRDIDIFFAEEADWAEACERFASDQRYDAAYENKNVKAYREKETGVVVELCRKIFGTPTEILKQFDFTITKCAYYKVLVTPLVDGETLLCKKFIEKDEKREIEYRLLIDDNFFEHLHFKRLVCDDAIPYPMSTFNRMFKYGRYGYFPCTETKAKIVKALRSASEDDIKMVESFYDGID